MTKNDNILIVIPARGGSKGIPRKNIKPLGGRPLIEYSIDVAREIAPDSHIVVSTDDEQFLSVARATGLLLDYRRPEELAGDSVGSREVILDVMDCADSKGIEYDRVLLLQPTSPFRTAEDVRGAMTLFDEQCDMVVSVMEAACNPYYDCFETDEDGLLHVAKGSGMITRRQDAPKAWQYNGAVYLIRPASIRAMGLGAFPKRIPFEMPRSRSIDLDTPLDWMVAEKLMEEKNSRRDNRGENEA